MRRLLSLIGLFAILPGCPQFDTGTTALRSAARILDCDEDDVDMEQIGEYRYRGEGCGETVVVACTSASLEPRCLVASDLERDDDEDSHDESDEDAPANAEVEEQVRAGLTARHDDIVACVGRARVGMRASYEPDGTVTFELQGELSGGAEERCVQEALGGVRVQATGESGVVVHLVR